MRSTCLCSQNDIIANVGVLLAAFLVGLLNSLWPDAIVVLAIAILFLKSAFEVTGEARLELARSRETGRHLNVVRSVLVDKTSDSLKTGVKDFVGSSTCQDQ